MSGRLAARPAQHYNTLASDNDLGAYTAQGSYQQAEMMLGGAAGRRHARGRPSDTLASMTALAESHLRKVSGPRWSHQPGADAI